MSFCEPDPLGIPLFGCCAPLQFDTIASVIVQVYFVRGSLFSDPPIALRQSIITRVESECSLATFPNNGESRYIRLSWPAFAVIQDVQRQFSLNKPQIPAGIGDELTDSNSGYTAYQQASSQPDESYVSAKIRRGIVTPSKMCLSTAYPTNCRPETPVAPVCEFLPSGNSFETTPPHLEMAGQRFNRLVCWNTGSPIAGFGTFKILRRLLKPAERIPGDCCDFPP